MTPLIGVGVLVVGLGLSVRTTILQENSLRVTGERSARYWERSKLVDLSSLVGLGFGSGQGCWGRWALVRLLATLEVTRTTARAHIQHPSVHS